MLLENRAGLLPLDVKARKVWLYGIDAAVAKAAGFTVVTQPKDADVAIVRVATPFEVLHPNHFSAWVQHEGRLDFRRGDAGYEAIEQASAAVPTIVAIDLDRPAILTNVKNKAKAILGTFGASDAAVLDVIAGRARAEGQAALRAAVIDERGRKRRIRRAPDDTAHPLYAIGVGGGAWRAAPARACLAAARSRRLRPIRAAEWTDTPVSFEPDGVAGVKPSQRRRSLQEVTGAAMRWGPSCSLSRRAHDRYTRDNTQVGFFAPMRFEADITDCEVIGKIPTDLNGAFVRVGGEFLYPPKFPGRCAR